MPAYNPIPFWKVSLIGAPLIKKNVSPLEKKVTIASLEKINRSVFLLFEVLPKKPQAQSYHTDSRVDEDEE